MKMFQITKLGYFAFLPFLFPSVSVTLLLRTSSNYSLSPEVPSLVNKQTNKPKLSVTPKNNYKATNVPTTSHISQYYQRKYVKMTNKVEEDKQEMLNSLDDGVKAIGTKYNMQLQKLKNILVLKLNNESDVKQLRLKGSILNQNQVLQHKELTTNSHMLEKSQETSVPENTSYWTETIKRKRETHSVKPRHRKKYYRKRNAKFNSVSINFI